MPNSKHTSVDILMASYIPVSSPIHRLGAGVKILCLVMIFCAIFLADSFESLFALCCFGLLVCRLSGVGLHEWAISVSRFKWMLGITFFANYIFRRHGLFDLPSAGASAFLTLQVLLAIVTSLTLTFTTTPWDLCKGITDLLRPLKKVSFPVDDIGLILALAVRFTPMFHMEVINIVIAQKARGIEWRSGGVSKKAQSIRAIIVPALYSAFRRADSLAIAIKSRQYHARIETRESIFYLSWADIVALLSIYVILISTIII